MKLYTREAVKGCIRNYKRIGGKVHSVNLLDIEKLDGYHEGYICQAYGVKTCLIAFYGSEGCHDDLYTAKFYSKLPKKYSPLIKEA